METECWKWIFKSGWKGRLCTFLMYMLISTGAIKCESSFVLNLTKYKVLVEHPKHWIPICCKGCFQNNYHKWGKVSFLEFQSSNERIFVSLLLLLQRMKGWRNAFLEEEVQGGFWLLNQSSVNNMLYYEDCPFRFRLTISVRSVEAESKENAFKDRRKKAKVHTAHVLYALCTQSSYSQKVI